MSDGTTLRFAASPPPEAPSPGERVVVLDTAWTADPALPRVVALRDIAGRVLDRCDLFATTTERLDRWAEAAGVVDILAFGDVSFWYYGRLAHWWWLHERLLWLEMLGELVRDGDVRSIAVEDPGEAALLDIAPLVARRDGLAWHPPAGEAPPQPPRKSNQVVTRRTRRWRRAVLALRARLLGPAYALDPDVRRPARRERRIRRLADSAQRPVLVVLEHARQRIGAGEGARSVNPYLGPILEHLTGTPLEPVLYESRSPVHGGAVWERSGPGEDRTLYADAHKAVEEPEDHAVAETIAAAAAARLRALAVPLEVDGVDLGPVLVGRVAAFVERSFAGQVRTVVRLRRLLRRLRPRAVLLADEYHRQDWLGAARAERVPVAAVQHGIIHRWHPGYVHASRPARLALPDRTYVFGAWERRLLTERSVFRPDEVVVAGSPRLDLVTPPGAGDRDAVRAELGVASGDRLVVVSTSWGTIVRRFHLPVVLARLVDRPLPGVHLVFKLHPAEPEDGSYRAIVEGVARARGFEPPPTSVVRDTDLYRLLGAADAHVGLFSTVLGEAVVTGTPNLIASGIAGGDLLDYVASGVACAVRDGGELLDALERGSGRADAEARAAYLREHFEPGSAGERIAADLRAWVGG